jgi:hypothetical protein
MLQTSQGKKVNGEVENQRIRTPRLSGKQTKWSILDRHHPCRWACLTIRTLHTYHLRCQTIRTRMFIHLGRTSIILSHIQHSAEAPGRTMHTSIPVFSKTDVLTIRHPVRHLCLIIGTTTTGIRICRDR